MDDQAKILPTHYQSSRGALEIATMAYPHVANALAKMDREGRSGDAVYAALLAHKAMMDAEAAEKADEPAVAEIGHNGAPDATPFERVKAKVDDLHIEAKNWLDGADVKSQDEADQIGKLLDMVRKASKEADAERIREKEPLDVAVKEIQDRYNTLIGNTKAVKGTAVRIEEGLKVALTGWLRKVAAKQEEERQERERIAREAAQKAEEAVAYTHDTTDLDERDAALRSVDAARQAAIDLAAANKAKAQAQGGERAIGLVTAYRPEIADLGAALRHFWLDRPNSFRQLVEQFAREDIRQGKRSIPGIIIHEERVAR